MAKEKVLKDHKRQGKKFLPPFSHILGPMNEVSWVKTVLPELLGIAVIQDYYDLSEGVRLVTELARSALNCSKPEKAKIFGSISSFNGLNDKLKVAVCSSLASSGALCRIQKAIFPLIAFYPGCPLRFLFSQEPSEADRSVDDLNKLKIIVENLYDKVSTKATMIQATMTWLGFDSGAIKVYEGDTMANFPEIEKYPYTELSRKVAASIRCTINILFSDHLYPHQSEWPQYFWNNGLKIDRCHFE